MTKRVSKSTWTMFRPKVLMGFQGRPTLEQRPLRWNSLRRAPTAQRLDFARISMICCCKPYCFQYAIESVAALVHLSPAAIHIGPEFCIHDKDYYQWRRDAGTVWFSLTSRHVLWKCSGVKMAGDEWTKEYLGRTAFLPTNFLGVVFTVLLHWTSFISHCVTVILKNVLFEGQGWPVGYEKELQSIFDPGIGSVWSTKQIEANKDTLLPRPPSCSDII